MKNLFLYLIEQSHNTGYDTYDSAVVVAPSVVEARKILPGASLNTWTTPENVTATRIGKKSTLRNYTEGEVICASFNAG